MKLENNAIEERPAANPTLNNSVIEEVGVISDTGVTNNQGLGIQPPDEGVHISQNGSRSFLEGEPTDLVPRYDRDSPPRYTEDESETVPPTSDDEDDSEDGWNLQYHDPHAASASRCQHPEHDERLRRNAGVAAAVNSRNISSPPSPLQPLVSLSNNIFVIDDSGYDGDTERVEFGVALAISVRQVRPGHNRSLGSGDSGYASLAADVPLPKRDDDGLEDLELLAGYPEPCDEGFYEIGGDVKGVPLPTGDGDDDF